MKIQDVRAYECFEVNSHIFQMVEQSTDCGSRPHSLVFRVGPNGGDELMRHGTEVKPMKLAGRTSAGGAVSLEEEDVDED